MWSNTSGFEPPVMILVSGHASKTLLTGIYDWIRTQITRIEKKRGAEAAIAARNQREKRIRSIIFQYEIQ